jgi:hypothetical protein
MGHTLFIVRNDNEEDAKTLRKMGTVDMGDLFFFPGADQGKEGGCRSGW